MSAIKIQDVSKMYRLYHEKDFNLKYAFLNFITGRRTSYYDEFWALKDISMDIAKGETIGIIGENGCGKSTLLKLIAGILYADEGRISTDGKIATLIEIGAGFHPELSGRENVYINGAVLGFEKKEIRKKYDEILSFSGLEKFIDNPIKTYSSGMYVRLGFSIAINVDPDILLVDEILAVGDEAFQKKCLEKIDRFKDKGKTILIVSHDLGTIEDICDQVFLLHNGRIHAQGRPVDVIAAYHRLLYQRGEKGIRAEQEAPAAEEAPAEGPSPGSAVNRWGSGEAEITGVEFYNAADENTEMFKTGDLMRVRIYYNAHQRIEKPVFGVAIHREEGIHINGPNTKTSNYGIDHIEGIGFIDYIIPSLPLIPGPYYFSASIYDFSCQHAYDHWERGFKFFVMESEAIKERYGVLYIPAEWRLHGQ